MTASASLQLRTTPRRRAFLLGPLAILALASTACTMEPNGVNNRDPHMRHGNIEAPGTHASDNQGQAGQRP